LVLLFKADFSFQGLISLFKTVDVDPPPGISDDPPLLEPGEPGVLTSGWG